MSSTPKAPHTPTRLHWLDGNLYTVEGYRFVASAFAEDGTEGMAPESPDAHLAPLLAAAPELYEALRAVVQSQDASNAERARSGLGTGSGYEPAYMKAARAVLAKVTP